MVKRGQVSVEYIATYGWAFMIIFATLGALLYFNIFDLSPHIQSKCEFYSGIYCTEFVTDEFGVTVVIQNGLPIDITQVSVLFEDCALASGATTLASGESQIYTATCSLLEGGTIDTTVEFNYTNPDSAIEHTKRGRLIDRVQ